MSRRRGRKNKDEIDPKMVILGIIIIVIYYVWENVIKPFIYWINQNLTLIIILVFTAILLLAWWLGRKEIKKDTPSSSDIHSFQDSPESNSLRFSNSEIKKNTKLERITEAIKKFEPHSDTRDEKELEKELTAHLKAWFRNEYDIESQYPIGKGRIDILVDKDTAIELKLADSRANVRNLEGQLSDYIENFPYVIAVILDVGKVEDLNDLVNRFKKKGVEVVIIKGGIKRNKSQPKVKVIVN